MTFRRLGMFGITFDNMRASGAIAFGVLVSARASF